MIKTALTEKLDDHPLSSANSASFANDTIVNQRINAEAIAAGMSHMADVSHNNPNGRNIPFYNGGGYGSAQAVNTPKAEGQVETHPKVRFAQVMRTSAAGASKSLTLS